MCARPPGRVIPSSAWVILNPLEPCNAPVFTSLSTPEGAPCGASEVADASRLVSVGGTDNCYEVAVRSVLQSMRASPLLKRAHRRRSVPKDSSFIQQHIRVPTTAPRARLGSENILEGEDLSPSVLLDIQSTAVGVSPEPNRWSGGFGPAGGCPSRSGPFLYRATTSPNWALPVPRDAGSRADGGLWDPGSISPARSPSR